MGVVKVVNGWPSIDIGRMRHEVRIQSEIASGTDASGATTEWKDFTTARIAIEAVRGSDVIKSGQTTTQLFLTVAMWFQEGILPNMRIVHDNGSTYLIQSIENVLEMSVVLVLNCIGIGVNV